MNLSPKMRDGLIILGVAGVLLLLVFPRKKGIAKPKIADTTKVDNVTNARIILDAFLNAVDAGESQKALNQLNQEFVKEYGMKVARNSKGKYVARTTDGKDVLMVK
jgi:hypothetical protein